MMQNYFAQLEQLLVPLVIAGLIIIFSLTFFMMWSRRIGQLRQSVSHLENYFRNSNSDGRETLIKAQIGRAHV